MKYDLEIDFANKKIKITSNPEYFSIALDAKF